MLPRRQRLSRAGFEGARAYTRKTTPHFVVSFSSTPHPAQAGVVVSKAVARRAVDRHRLRRRVYSALHPFVAQGISVLVLAKKGSLSLPYEALVQELVGVLGHSVGR